ncbi:hypothetical protein LJC55_03195 [Eubacteriales bacterium OttesenSCG-928-N14]|nr:hypothetical protein [Eubacteriales bacterium OttesenSCG-928-N14]
MRRRALRSGAGKVIVVCALVFILVLCCLFLPSIIMVGRQSGMVGKIESYTPPLLGEGEVGQMNVELLRSRLHYLVGEYAVNGERAPMGREMSMEAARETANAQLRALMDAGVLPQFSLDGFNIYPNINAYSMENDNYAYWRVDYIYEKEEGDFGQGDQLVLFMDARYGLVYWMEASCSKDTLNWPMPDVMANNFANYLNISRTEDGVYDGVEYQVLNADNIWLCAKLYSERTETWGPGAAMQVYVSLEPLPAVIRLHSVLVP